MVMGPCVRRDDSGGCGDGTTHRWQGPGARRDDGLAGWAKRSVPTIDLRIRMPVGTARCASAHPTRFGCRLALISIQHIDRQIQHRRERDPAGVGDEQQGRDPVRAPLHDDEGHDQHEHAGDDRERGPHQMRGEEHRRPREVQHQLSPPHLHDGTAHHPLIGAPAGHRDHDVEHGPGDRKQPAGRGEPGLVERPVPGARHVGRTDDPAASDHEDQEDEEMQDGSIHIPLGVISGSVRWRPAAMRPGHPRAHWTGQPAARSQDITQCEEKSGFSPDAHVQGPGTPINSAPGS
ncbi:hypothetical protein BRAS3809_3350002 [Bradyrhizobium sp. STM 3809]|nr:hypothetical protein BRAS3809_3350002 [Bradyrhizobium sp. STM 3809]